MHTTSLFRPLFRCLAVSCVVVSLLALTQGLFMVPGPSGLPAQSPFLHIAQASGPSQEGAFDAIADMVFGQPDFTSNQAAEPPTAMSLKAPRAMTVHSDTGRLFVADTDNHRILSWPTITEYQLGDVADLVIGQPDFATADAPTPPTAATLYQPAGVALNPQDDLLYVADTGNNRIVAYAPPFTIGMEATLVLGQSSFVTDTLHEPPTAATLSAPAGLAFDSQGRLFVADSENNRILIYAAPIQSGMEATNVLGQPDFVSNQVSDTVSASTLNYPRALALTEGGHSLYVADSGNNRVLAYALTPFDSQADAVFGQPDFASRAIPDTPSAESLYAPNGLALDSFGRLYVADTNNNRVLVYSGQNPTAMFVMGQADLSGNEAPTPPTAASLSTPMGVMVDAHGDVYVADAGNHRVLRYLQPLQAPAYQLYIPILMNAAPATD